jgi:segregation and condensation protein A
VTFANPCANPLLRPCAIVILEVLFPRSKRTRPCAFKAGTWIPPLASHQAVILLACDARTCQISTVEFDGPLELLLFLVRQHGVDIRDVPIAPITKAYLAQLTLIEALELDTAGEFLVIAATLCLIKSREMFPRSPLFAGDQDEEDPAALREALGRRLLEYERYQEASQSLADRPWLDRDVFARIQPATPPNERLLDPGVDALGLLEVFYEVLQRHAADPPSLTVSRESVTIQEIASWLTNQLKTGPREFNDLLRALGSTAQRVMAFVATLELSKLHLIDVRQAHHLGPVVLESLRAPDDHELNLLMGGVA